MARQQDSRGKVPLNNLNRSLACELRDDVADVQMIDSVEAEGDVDLMRIARRAGGVTGADLAPQPIAATGQVHEALLQTRFH